MVGAPSGPQVAWKVLLVALPVQPLWRAHVSALLGSLISEQGAQVLCSGDLPPFQGASASAVPCEAACATGSEPRFVLGWL